MISVRASCRKTPPYHRDGTLPRGEKASDCTSPGGLYLLWSCITNQKGRPSRTTRVFSGPVSAATGRKSVASTIPAAVTSKLNTSTTFFPHSLSTSLLRQSSAAAPTPGRAGQHR